MRSVWRNAARLGCVVLALSLCACGDEGSGETEDSKTSPANWRDAKVEPDALHAQLDGRRFKLVQWEGFTPLPESAITMEFHGTDMWHTAGCNGSSGIYQVRGETFTYFYRGTTLKGCPRPEQHEQDDWLVSFFRANPELEQSGNALTFTTTNAKLVFVEVDAAMKP